MRPTMILQKGDEGVSSLDGTAALDARVRIAVGRAGLLPEELDRYVAAIHDLCPPPPANPDAAEHKNTKREGKVQRQR